MQHNMGKNSDAFSAYFQVPSRVILQPAGLTLHRLILVAPLLRGKSLVFYRYKQHFSHKSGHRFKSFITQWVISDLNLFRQSVLLLVSTESRTKKYHTYITRISSQTAGLAFGSTGLCSYRVRGVDGSCAEHLTVESYTVFICQVILRPTIMWYSITHSLFHSRLKTFLFCKSFPLQPFLSFS